MTKAKWTKEKLQPLYDFYCGNYNAMANHLKISRARIDQLGKRFNLGKATRNQFTIDEKFLVLNYIKKTNERSRYKIAKALGMSEHTISTIAKQHGIMLAFYKTDDPTRVKVTKEEFLAFYNGNIEETMRHFDISFSTMKRYLENYL